MSHHVPVEQDASEGGVTVTAACNQYATIVADPPWRYTKRPNQPSSQIPYPTLTLDEIAALPIDQLAAKDAHLYLWTTSTHLEHAWKIVRGWKFNPISVLVWAKKPHNLVLGFPVFPICTEYILFCRRGKLEPLARSDRNWFDWPRGEHSQKPEAFLDLVEQTSPAPRLELFARRNRLGWDTWGNESLNHIQLEDPASDDARQHMDSPRHRRRREARTESDQRRPPLDEYQTDRASRIRGSSTGDAHPGMAVVE